MTTGDPIDKLALKYEPDNNMSNNHLDALWHSGPLLMFSPENISNTETVSLIRNTNDITISITRQQSGRSFKIQYTIDSGKRYL